MIRAGLEEGRRKNEEERRMTKEEEGRRKQEAESRKKNEEWLYCTDYSPVLEVGSLDIWIN